MKGTVPYYVEVKGEHTDSEDAEVAGTYLVEVDASLDEKLHASAVLDCFHGNVAISCLDGFSISVVDANGNGVVEEEGYDSSSLSLEKKAEFCGSVDPSEVPAPAANAI